MDTEDNDQDTSNSGNDRQRFEQPLPDDRSRGAQENENQAEAGHEGEGIFGYVWSPQAIYTRWYLKKRRPWRPFKPGSDCFIGMRRYKAVKGLTDGFLEVTYKAMRGKIYHVQAPYKWTRGWRHVAVAWDAEKAKLEIHLDGKLASGKVMLNGKPNADKVFHSAPSLR